MARGGLFIVDWGFVRAQPGYLQSDVRPWIGTTLCLGAFVIVSKVAIVESKRERLTANNKVVYIKILVLLHTIVPSVSQECSFHVIILKYYLSVTAQDTGARQGRLLDKVGHQEHWSITGVLPPQISQSGILSIFNSIGRTYMFQAFFTLVHITEKNPLILALPKDLSANAFTIRTGYVLNLNGSMCQR